MDITPAAANFDPSSGHALYSTLHVPQLVWRLQWRRKRGIPGKRLYSAPHDPAGAQQLASFNVTPGSTQVRVKISNASASGADLDLYVVFEADGAPGITSGDILAGFSADEDSEEEVSFANPPPGTYYALIDGFSVPGGSTAYDYLDVFVNQGLVPSSSPIRWRRIRPGKRGCGMPRRSRTVCRGLAGFCRAPCE